MYSPYYLTAASVQPQVSYVQKDVATDILVGGTGLVLAVGIVATVVVSIIFGYGFTTGSRLASKYPIIK
jgi:hypothetical protein